MSRFRVPTLVAILGLSASALPQETTANPAEPQRGDLRGVVRASNGENVADAAVELWLRPCANGIPLGAEDFVRAKADKRGRFTAKLLEGYAYSAVCMWRDAEGKQRQSMLVEGCRSGTLQRFEESESGRATTLDVKLTFDREKYGLHGDLRAIFYVDGLNRRVLKESVFESGKAQKIEIPFSDSRGHLAVVIRDDRGPIHQSNLSADQDRRPWRYEVRTGEPLTLHVVDSDGKAIEGAEIASQQVPTEGWRVDAVTDAMGNATSSSATRNASSWTLRIRADGYRESLAFRSRTRGNVNGKVVNPWLSDSAIKIVLEKAATLSGRVLDTRGRGVPGIGIVLSRKFSLKTAPNSSRGFPRTDEVLRCDADGRYSLPALAQAQDPSWRTILPPKVYAGLRGPASAVPPAHVDLTPQGKLGVDASKPPLVDLRTWKTSTYKVRLPGGLPARDACIVPVGELSTNRQRAFARAPRTDRRGICSLLERGSQASYVVLLQGTGWSRFDTGTKESGDREADAKGLHTIELTPFTKRLVHVVDADGEPIVGASVSITGSSWSGNSIDLDIARAMDAIGLNATSDEAGSMTLWSIDVPQLSHRLQFRKGSTKLTLPLPAPSKEPWIVRLSR